MKLRKQYFVPFLIIMMSVLFSFTSFGADNLQVHFLNVGQADSTLITCGNYALLIDAGNNDDDIPVLNYIQNKQGLSHLDYVICTHPHEDHIGAMDAVINAIDIDTIIMPDVTTTTQTFVDLLTAIDDNELSITLPEVGKQYSLGDAVFTIIGPVGSYGDDLNAWSIGLIVTYGDTNFIFTGDAEEASEIDLLSTGIDLKANVFKAGHHGSNTSNSNMLLDAINPDYAVISCGLNNSYGHPGEETLQRFQERGIKIFRTDTQGTIVATSDGINISWSAEPTDNWSSGNGYIVNTNNASSIQDESSDTCEVDTVEITVHITETGSKYHSAGCQYLKKSDIEVDLSDAIARGLTPCSKCNPPK